VEHRQPNAYLSLGWGEAVSETPPAKRKRSLPASWEERTGLAPNVAVVDTGPLYAAVDRGDQDHLRSVAVLQQQGLRLVIPALVIAEACYLIGTRLGPVIEARFVATLADFDVRAPEPSDWKRIGALVDQYGDFPLGGIDASVVALAERLRTRLIITLDRRHFGAVRSASGQPFELLPTLRRGH
jgi:predicted nucleic acid-binding protein